MIYIIVDKFVEATHWMPIEDEFNAASDVTIGKKYKIIIDFHDDESVIVDDTGCYSIIYLCHNGVLLKEIN